MSRSLVCWTVLLATEQFLMAQTPTAQLTGRVMDPSGGVIVGAQVTIKNTETGIRRESTSNEVGSYTFPLLDPGNYEVTTSKEGFRPISRSGLTLHVGQVARIDFVMELGSVSETVEIRGEAPLLDSETSSLGSVIQNRQIVNMPLNSRNSVALAVLVPGVVPGPVFNNSGVDVRIPTNILINGGRANTSEIFLSPWESCLRSMTFRNSKYRPIICPPSSAARAAARLISFSSPEQTSCTEVFSSSCVIATWTPITFSAIARVSRWQGFAAINSAAQWAGR